MRKNDDTEQNGNRGLVDRILREEDLDHDVHDLSSHHIEFPIPNLGLETSVKE